MSKLEELVRTMFTVLDKIEMSNNGREFHPTTISSVRSFDASKLNKALLDMRTELGIGEPPKLCSRSEIEPGICPWCNGTGDTQNHERESNDCTLCDRSGYVKDCSWCNGTGQNNDDIYNQGKDCTVCNGLGLVADKDR